jgi:site-specific recombinase XerD
LNWKGCKALKAWLKVRRAQVAEKELTTDGLWLSRVGTPLQARAIRKMVKKYMAQAGIEDASVNSLRHTMATHYLAKGGDLRGIQDMLDHESLETTQVYVALAKKVQRQMVQDLAL